MGRALSVGPLPQVLVVLVVATFPSGLNRPDQHSGESGESNGARPTGCAEGVMANFYFTLPMEISAAVRRNQTGLLHSRATLQLHFNTCKTPFHPALRR